MSAATARASPARAARTTAGSSAAWTRTPAVLKRMTADVPRMNAFTGHNSNLGKWMGRSKLCQRFDSPQQFYERSGVNGLHEVRVKSNILRSNQVSVTAPAGQRHNARTLLPRGRTHALADLEPVHSRHPEVEQHYAGLEILRPFQRSEAVVRHDHFVPEDPQEPGDRFGAIAIVIDNQNASRRDRPRETGGTGRSHRRRGGSGRQPYDELTAPIDPGAVRFDRSAVQLNELTHERQTDPETSIRSFRPARPLIELIEGAHQI